MNARSDLMRLLDRLQWALVEREEHIAHLERELERQRDQLDAYVLELLAARTGLQRAQLLSALEALEAMDYTSEAINALTDALYRLAVASKLIEEEVDDEAF